MSEPKTGECGHPITGRGVKSAKLCISCWAEILTRLENGEHMSDLAREVGVNPATIAHKRAEYVR